MALSDNTAVRSGGLRPVSGGASVQGVNPDRTVVTNLERLSAIIDPAGTGPMAQLMKKQEEVAIRETTAAFERDGDITEIQILQENPMLRGASSVVGRYLDHLRGAKAGRIAVQQAQIEFAKKGLTGADPGTVAQTYTQFRDGARNTLGGGLGKHGLSAFDAAFAEEQRKIEDKAVTEHIDKMDRDQIAAVGDTVRTNISKFNLKDDWAGNAHEAMIHRVDGQAFGVTEPEFEELLFNETMAFSNQNVAEGGDIWRAYLNEPGLVTDPANIARYAAAARAADSAKIAAESADYEAKSKKYQEQLDQFKGEVGTAIGNEEDPAVVARMNKKLNELPLEIRGDAALFLGTATEKSRSLKKNATPDSAMRVYRGMVFKGQLSIDQIMALDLEGSQTQTLKKDLEDFRRGGSILQNNIGVASAKKMISGIPSQAGFDRKFNPDVYKKVQDGLAEFDQRMIQMAASDPELLNNQQASQKLATDVAKSIRDEILLSTGPGVKVAKPAKPQTSEQMAPTLDAMRKQRDQLMTDVADLAEKRAKAREEAMRAAREGAHSAGLIEPEPNPEAEEVWQLDDPNILLFNRGFDEQAP